MNESLLTDEPPRVLAPPELVAQAEELVKKYDAQCFWFWHPEARVRYLDDVRQVVQLLREYGNQQAWKSAQTLNQCLLQVSKKMSLP